MKRVIIFISVAIVISLIFLFPKQSDGCDCAGSLLSKETLCLGIPLCQETIVAAPEKEPTAIDQTTSIPNSSNTTSVLQNSTISNTTNQNQSQAVELVTENPVSTSSNTSSNESLVCSADCATIRELLKATELGTYEQFSNYTYSNNEREAIVLAIDTSESMQRRIGHAKEAAKQLIDLIGYEDSVLILSFDQETKISYGFTNDKTVLKSQIDALTVGLGTDGYELFRKTNLVLNTFDAPVKKLIVITDGIFWDDGTNQTAIEAAQATYCINIITQGVDILKDKNKEKRIKNLVNACGSYYYSPETPEELFTLMNLIYHEIEEGSNELSLRIKLSHDLVAKNENVTISSLAFSSYTGMVLPFSNDAYCIEAPIITLNTKELSTKGSWQELSTNDLIPGENILVLHAKIPGCNIVGSKEFEVIVQRNKDYDFLTVLFILLLVGSSSYFFIKPKHVRAVKLFFGFK
ncbi:MAG: VWA domain-containing protein [Candidatus Woesearchaeota archaeon]|nr:MAG: VWA domain-containing protein [Candidatus Woesearchaeota archaeon]